MIGAIFLSPCHFLYVFFKILLILLFLLFPRSLILPLHIDDLYVCYKYMKKALIYDYIVTRHFSQ